MAWPEANILVKQPVQLNPSNHVVEVLNSTYTLNVAKSCISTFHS